MEDRFASAPPTTPDHPLPEEPPRWPTVVGAISIVWASLNILCGGCGVLSPLLMSTFLEAAERDYGPMPDVMKPGALQIGLYAVGLVWAFVLLAAGIALTLRKPVARPLHLVYGAVSVLLSIVGIVIGVMAQIELSEWLANNPDNPWAKQHNPAATYVGMAFGVLLGLAWPVFCLVWFGLVKRTPRDITGEPA